MCNILLVILLWGRVVTDLMQPGEELEFYRKGILNLKQRGDEAITTKGAYIGDWIDISEIFIFHLIY